MPRYVVLGHFTDEQTHQGSETTKRAESVEAAAKKVGASMKNVYWTLGRYDIVAVVDARDEAAAVAFLKGVDALRDIQTECLRALSRNELERMRRAGGPWIPAPQAPATRGDKATPTRATAGAAGY